MSILLTRAHMLQQTLKAYGYSSNRINSFIQEAFDGDLDDATEEELTHVITVLEGYVAFAEKCRNIQKRN